jgi:hypothetical protein
VEAAAPTGDLSRQLRDFAALLAEDDYRAFEAWPALAAALRETLGAGVVEELGRLVTGFDFQGALARLRALLPAVAP